jgi:lipopolysaccharide export system permease protein
VFNKEFPGITFYAHQVDNEKGELKFAFVRDDSIKGTSVVVVAPEAQVVSSPQDATIHVVFHNGRIFRKNGDELNILKFGKYSIKLDLGKLLTGFNFAEQKAKDMPFFRLWDIRNDHSLMPDQDERFYRKVDTEFYKRLTLPLGCFILGMFAISIASVFRGLKQQYGLLLAMGLFMVYYTMFSIGVSMGESGTIPPEYGMWAPDVLFVFVALFGMRYANLERTPTVVHWLTHLRLFKKGGEAGA